MAKLRAVRGTQDLLPEAWARHCHVEETARRVAGRFNYRSVATPIFEFTEVFARTLGETSDVVTKEMYTFADKGGDSLTLRPENTAGVARAFISGTSGSNCRSNISTAGRCSAMSVRRRGGCANSTRSASRCWE